MPEGVRTQTKGAADAGPPPGPEEFRAVLSRLASGVVAVTGLDSEGRPAGLTVSSFVSVSLDPPLVSFCVARTSRTWPLLRAGGRVCVNILSEGQAADAARFAVRDADRFGGGRLASPRGGGAAPAPRGGGGGGARGWGGGGGWGAGPPAPATTRSIWRRTRSVTSWPTSDTARPTGRWPPPA